MSARSRALSALSASLLALTWLAGCGSDTPAANDRDGQPSSNAPTSASTTSTTPTTPTTSSSTDAPAPTARSLGKCLLSVDAVTEVIAGAWEVVEDATGCSFRSDRGALLAVQPVGPEGESRDSLAAGLEVARTSCSATAREVAGNGAFACVEEKEDGTMVVGNVIASGRLWVVVIPAPPTAEGQSAVLDAMVAMLGQLPPA